ncbi:MAG: SDR family NAD(P)-dependent oxidoreductase [Patulibacter sp.]|nr:SDR family NAD(P)-dependent oxidoreductase [Patulibacter sp.]
MSRIDLRDRGVLVTGATGAVGAATARLLVERGARVVLMSRPSERLEAIEDELAPEGAVAVAAKADDRAAVIEAVDEGAGLVGGLVGVVAAAGLVRPSTIAEQSEEDVRAVVDTNLYGTLWTFQASLPHVDRTGGHLLAIASIAGLAPVGLAGIYPATKAAIAEVVSQLRIELMHRETSVGAVYLGMVSSGMSDDVKAHEQAGPALTRTLGGPLTRALTAEDAAEQIVRALEHRSRAVVTPWWQIPVAAPQLAVHGLVEQGLRLSALAGQLPRGPVRRSRR